MGRITANPIRHPQKRLCQKKDLIDLCPLPLRPEIEPQPVSLPQRVASTAAGPIEPASHAATSPGSNGSWLGAWAKLQRYSAEAHKAAQRAMLDSHLAYLRSAELAQRQLSAIVSGEGFPMDEVSEGTGVIEMPHSVITSPLDFPTPPANTDPAVKL
jgi:hypothetical protein